MKIGPEYVHSSEDNLARDHARVIYMEKVRTLVPAVLADLHKDVFPIFQEIVSSKINGEETSTEPLRMALLEWAKRYKLTDGWPSNGEWVLDTALNTLRYWSAYCNPEKLWWWYPAGPFSPLQYDDEEANFELRYGYDPALCTRSDFMKRVIDYMDRMDALARKQGFTNCRDYSPENRNIEHFEWLVRYQVQGWKYREIADDYLSLNGKVITEDMIGKGVKKIAKQIGIKLRPAGKGRPPKEKPN